MRGILCRARVGSRLGLSNARLCQQRVVLGRLSFETKNPWLQGNSESETLSKCSV